MSGGCSRVVPNRATHDAKAGKARSELARDGERFKREQLPGSASRGLGCGPPKGEQNAAGSRSDRVRSQVRGLPSATKVPPLRSQSTRMSWAKRRDVSEISRPGSKKNGKPTA